MIRRARQEFRTVEMRAHIHTLKKMTATGVSAISRKAKWNGIEPS